MPITKLVFAFILLFSVSSLARHDALSGTCNSYLKECKGSSSDKKNISAATIKCINEKATEAGKKGKACLNALEQQNPGQSTQESTEGH